MSEKVVIPGMSPIGIPADLNVPSIEQRIIDFVDGRSDGAELMLALYGDIADEPLPPRLAALLARWRTC